MTSSPPPENTPPSTSTSQLQVQAPVAARKFPAPCWSQDETLSLIHAYQDKWFSLRRRNLRTADWESVADEVNRRCPNQSPPKTSAQCRHKMEKLRKRYRTEKQRISNLPHHHHHFAGNRLFPPSSWVFFDLMDAMEIGSASGSGSASVSASIPTTTTTTLLPNHPPPITYNNNNNNNNNADLNVHNPSYDYNPNPPKHHFNNNTRPKEDLGKYFDDILMSVGKGPIKFKLKNNNYADHHHHHHHNTPPPPPPDFDFDYNNSTTTSAAKNFASGTGTGTRVNLNKRKLGSSASAGFMNLNGCSSKRGGRSTSKRAFADADADADADGDDVVGDMVASINMLGDGLLKMEKMKMQMMQDLQRQRMEMELNNSKMILESQHTILNAFLQGFNKLNNLKQSNSCNYKTR